VRTERGHRMSLTDFIIVAIGEIPGLPDDISTKELEKTAGLIVNEVKEQMEYNLPQFADEVVQ